MNMTQSQIPEDRTMLTYLVRLYAFLKERDAKIIELFFLGLNLWTLVVFALPRHTLDGPILEIIQNTAPQIILVIVQTLFTGINITALIYDRKYIRITAALLNVAFMLFYATSSAMLYNPNVGMYALLAMLAAFVCWKINIRM